MKTRIETGETLSEDQATDVFEAVKADILKAVDLDHDEALRLGYKYVRLEMQFICGLYEAMFSPEFDDVLPLELELGMELRQMKKEASVAILNADFGNFTSLKKYLHNLGEMYVGDGEQADFGKQLLTVSDRIADIGEPVAG